MYAILAYKTPFVSPTATRWLLSFEVINMGCFNGLNLQGAFTPGAAGGSHDLSFEVSDTGAPLWVRNVADTANVAKAFGRGTAGINSAVRELGGTRGQYEILGIGYLSYFCNPQKTYAQMQPIAQITPNNKKRDPYVGSLLQREGFFQQYRCPVRGNTQQTLRELTPNEIFLSNALSPFNAGTIGFEEQLRDTGSCLAPTFMSNKAWHGSLYQMVGSERPSGQAIAYLQAWRNCTELNVSQGWEHYTSALHVITQLASERMYNTKSVIAVLSQLCNSGDDSDIITYAGNHYLSYCAAVGFWKTANLFRNTESMLDEGRYNKGGQSSSIRDKLYRMRSMASRSQHHALWSVTLGADLDKIEELNNAQIQLNNNTSPSNLAYYARGDITDSDRQSFLDNVIARIRTIWMVDPIACINNYFSQAVQLPDLSVPAPQAAPVTTTNSFTQWVATEENTVH